jgi:hypothetical protein
MRSSDDVWKAKIIQMLFSITNYFSEPNQFRSIRVDVAMSAFWRRRRRTSAVSKRRLWLKDKKIAELDFKGRVHVIQRREVRWASPYF